MTGNPPRLASGRSLRRATALKVRATAAAPPGGRGLDGLVEAVREEEEEEVARRGETGNPELLERENLVSQEARDAEEEEEEEEEAEEEEEEEWC